MRLRASRVDLDPSMFSAHSLRSGLASEAAKAGATHAEIANTTGHKSHAMVQSYIQDHQAWTNNAARKAGL